MTAVNHEYEAAKAEYYMDTNDFRAGKYVVADVSQDPTWSDVKAVESHWNKADTFTGFVNHRERDFKAACAALEALGAKQKETV